MSGRDQIYFPIHTNKHEQEHPDQKLFSTVEPIQSNTHENPTKHVPTLKEEMQILKWK
jgi:hypothetical protein